MLLGNVLARLVAILHLLLCSNLRFDQLKTSGTWDWNSTPFVCLASGEDRFGVSLISLLMRILSLGSLLRDTRLRVFYLCFHIGWNSEQDSENHFTV